MFLGDTYVTQYSYGNGFITLSARSSKDTGSIAEIQENVNLIGRWINNIHSSLSPTNIKRTNFKENIEKTNTGLVGKFTCGVDFGKVVFNLDEQTLEFDARPSVVLNFNDFQGWHQFLNRMISESVRFNG